MRGVDQLADGQPVAEGRPDRFAGGDGGQEILGLDDDLVLIAGAVSGALAKGKVVWMRRPGQNTGETARRLWSLGAVKVDGVLVFLIEPDAALCAMNFIGIAHLPPRRRAADVKMPHGPCSKAQHDLGMVIICHGHGAIGSGAGGVDGFNPRAQFRNRAHQRQHAIDRMRGKVAHAAIRAAGRAPGRGHRWVGQKVFGMLTAKPGDGADRAFSQQLAHELGGGGADIVEADHVWQTRRLCSCHHGLCVFKRGTQRLFTKHRFASGKGGLGNRAVG